MDFDQNRSHHLFKYYFPLLKFLVCVWINKCSGDSGLVYFNRQPSVVIHISLSPSVATKIHKLPQRLSNVQDVHNRRILLVFIGIPLVMLVGGCLVALAEITIGFRSRFSQCVDYMRFNEKSFCFRWQETTKLMLFGSTKTSSLVILCDLRYLTGNISSVMTKHMGVQRKLHRFAYLIVQIILCFYS